MNTLMQCSPAAMQYLADLGCTLMYVENGPPKLVVPSDGCSGFLKKPVPKYSKKEGWENFASLAKKRNKKKAPRKVVEPAEKPDGYLADKSSEGSESNTDSEPKMVTPVQIQVRMGVYGPKAYIPPHRKRSLEEEKRLKNQKEYFDKVAEAGVLTCEIDAATRVLDTWETVITRFIETRDKNPTPEQRGQYIDQLKKMEAKKLKCKQALENKIKERDQKLKEASDLPHGSGQDTNFNVPPPASTLSSVEGTSYMAPQLSYSASEARGLVMENEYYRKELSPDFPKLGDAIDCLRKNDRCFIDSFMNNADYRKAISETVDVLTRLQDSDGTASYTSMRKKTELVNAVSGVLGDSLNMYLKSKEVQLRESGQAHFDAKWVLDLSWKIVKKLFLGG